MRRTFDHARNHGRRAAFGRQDVGHRQDREDPDGRGQKVGVVKFDSLSTSDDEIYVAPVCSRSVGLAGSVCPDHFFVSNIDDCVGWGRRNGARHADRRERRAVQPLLAAYPRRAGDLRRRQSLGRAYAAQDRPHAETRRRGGDHQGRHRLAGRTRGVRPSMSRLANPRARRAVLQRRDRTGRGRTGVPHRRGAAYRDAGGAAAALSHAVGRLPLLHRRNLRSAATISAATCAR